MRPDSQLYIVPAEGGAARRLRCNTPLMNSGTAFRQRALAGLLLEEPFALHADVPDALDAEGNSSPAIMIDNATAAIARSTFPSL